MLSKMHFRHDSAGLNRPLSKTAKYKKKILDIEAEYSALSKMIVLHRKKNLLTS